MKKHNLLFLILSVILSLSCYILYRIFDYFVILIIGIIFFILGLFFLNGAQSDRKERIENRELFKNNYEKIISNPTSLFDQIVCDFDRKEILDKLGLTVFKRGGFIDSECTLELLFKGKVVIIKKDEFIINDNRFEYENFKSIDEIYKKIREAN